MRPLETKILLIADTVFAARMQGMLTEVQGREFSLQHVQDLGKGLSLLKTGRFEIVLVDLDLSDGMAEESGLEAALTVRKESGTVPVLALTTRDDVDMAMKAWGADIQDCLVKGQLSGPLLAHAITLWIRRKRDSDLLRKSNENLELHLVQLEEQNLELRSAQVEAEVLEEKYHNLFHLAPVGYLTIDKSGKVVEANEFAALLLGREKMWFREGKFTGSLRSFLDSESWPTLSKFLTAMLSSRSQHRCEVRLLPGAGVEFLQLEGIKCLGDVDKEENFQIALIDITERKRAEEKIIHLNGLLSMKASELEKLNEVLSMQTTKLEGANQELEAFNYTVAHDLRQPLNHIFLACQAIKVQCGDRLGEECLASLNAAYRGVERMTNLVETLLRFSQVGKVELKREEVDLSTVAQTIADNLKATAPQRMVRFEIIEGIRVDGADLLRVVLDNLFSNAWKFTASQAKAVISFGMAKVDRQAVYFVRDNGPGFDMTEAGNVFAPFTRLSGAKSYKGSGIGLATVERIIVRHGGRVWAEGEPGKGATFYFSFPGGAKATGAP
jgi:PAS domain S-box-containing protein